MSMPTLDERRHAARLLRDEKVVLQILAAPARPDLVGVTVHCATVDVSATGLRLRLGSPVVTGSKLGLEVDLMERAERYFLGGEVVWSRQAGTAGGYLIGVRLLEDRCFELERWGSHFR